MRAEWIVQNPGASAPLVVELEVECNTPTETILDNIRRNSEGRTGWQKLEDAHERIAILCGSGPSLSDTLGDIRGGDIFALNGAAAFLDRNGIIPDYQVILDAKPETVRLIGPAKQHLFASQVDPECFSRVPTAKLWHATHGTLVPDFPEYQDDYCLIGGAVSVGNAALVLAYAMGYRTIHCHGFDSSHRGDRGHAFAQPMNDGDPTTVVSFGGQEYVASLTMSLQARYFLQRAAQLKASGCEIHVHGSGLLPAMFNAPWSEEDKYAELWRHPEYRDVAPGELCAETFLELVKPDSLVIDFGCGTGRGALKIREAGLEVLCLDLTDNCRDVEALSLPFRQHDLTEPIDFIEARYGYCTDVMEHLPTEDVDTVLSNIMRAAETVFFQISTVPDNFGGVIGKELHLTVKPAAWWRERFRMLGYSVRWEKDQGSSVNFIVSQ